MIENTSDHFDPTSATEEHYFDVEKSERLIKEQEELALQKYAETIFENDEVVKELDSYENNLDSQVKNDKKSQAKEQLKILKQFDAIADSFTKTRLEPEGERKETAGMLKKSNKPKKEKTLAAKLRLKAKKNK